MGKVPTNYNRQDIDPRLHTVQSYLHLDNSWESMVAKDEMVEGDTALEPARYHFLMVSTTLAFSTINLVSSFPSKDTTICTTNNNAIYLTI